MEQITGRASASCEIVHPKSSLPHRQRDFHTTTQEAQKSAYQNRAAKSREKYQQELAAYNANKKAAAKADAAPAAEAAPSKKRKKLCGFQNFTARDSPVDFHTGKKSEDGGEKKKVAFRRGRLEPSNLCLQESFPHKEVYLCDFTGVRSTQKKKKSKKKDA